MASEHTAPDPSDEIVSEDDEIDYSKKPEFYDSDLDDKDEAWMQRKRQGRQTDALLSCPACFTTLCIDCQRHETILTQYRAMFVLNCKVKSQRSGLAAGTRKRKREPRKRSSGQHKNAESIQEDDKAEVVKPVCCSVCDTEVAIRDEDEIYHFFNVLPSYG